MRVIEGIVEVFFVKIESGWKYNITVTLSVYPILKHNTLLLQTFSYIHRIILKLILYNVSFIGVQERYGKVTGTLFPIAMPIICWKCAHTYIIDKELQHTDDFILCIHFLSLVSCLPN